MTEKKMIEELLDRIEQVDEALDFIVFQADDYNDIKNALILKRKVIKVVIREIMKERGS